MTTDEIKDQIIQKQDELLKIDNDIIIVYWLLSFEDSFSTQANKLENERDFLYEKFRDIKNELASLLQQLEKSKETKLSLPLNVPKTREINSTCYNRYKEAYNPDGFSTDAFKEGAKWAIEEIKRRNEK